MSRVFSKKVSANRGLKLNAVWFVPRKKSRFHVGDRYNRGRFALKQMNSWLLARKRQNRDFCRFLRHSTKDVKAWCACYMRSSSHSSSSEQYSGVHTSWHPKHGAILACAKSRSCLLFSLCVAFTVCTFLGCLAPSCDHGGVRQYATGASAVLSKQVQVIPD